MAFPKFKGKHLEKAILTPTEFLRYKKRIGDYPKQKVPEGILLIFSRRFFKNILKHYKAKEIKNVYGALFSLKKANHKVGVRGKFGIGAPLSAIIVEDLIALGSKKFIIVGTAGGISKKLKIGDIVVINKSIRDEGTSHHYLKNSKYVYPSKALTKKLVELLQARKEKFYVAPSWTIDAFYRETVKEMEHYAKEGVLTVEMEASALFAVGQYRNVDVAAIVVVSDLHGSGKWRAKWRSSLVRNKLLKIFDISTEALSS